MHSFFVGESGFFEGHAWLSEEDAAHALRVLRMKPGDTVALSDGKERYEAELEAPEDGRLRARLLSPLPSNEPALRVTLFQGLPKGERMDYIVQKATEIGVEAIVPVHLARCVAQPSEKAAERQQKRWQRIALEAAKQCGRAAVPEILPIRSWAALKPCVAQYQHFVIPWEEEATAGHGIRQALAGATGTVGLLIGPEGGITGEEVAELRALGAQTVGLGPRILRTDTAAICALTLALSGDAGILE